MNPGPPSPLQHLDMSVVRQLHTVLKGPGEELGKLYLHSRNHNPEDYTFSQWVEGHHLEDVWSKAVAQGLITSEDTVTPLGRDYLPVLAVRWGHAVYVATWGLEMPPGALAKTTQTIGVFDSLEALVVAWINLPDEGQYDVTALLINEFMRPEML